LQHEFIYKIPGEKLDKIIFAVNGTLMLGESYVIPEQKEINEFRGWLQYISAMHKK